MLHSVSWNIFAPNDPGGRSSLYTNSALLCGFILTATVTVSSVISTCSPVDLSCSDQLGDGSVPRPSDGVDDQSICQSDQTPNGEAGRDCSCGDRSCEKQLTCRAPDFVCSCDRVCGYPALGPGSEAYFEEFGCYEPCERDGDCEGANQVCFPLDIERTVSACLEKGSSTAGSFRVRLLPEGRTPLAGDFTTVSVRVDFDGADYVFDAGSGHLYTDPFMGEMVVLMFLKFGWPDLLYFQIYLPRSLYSPGSLSMFVYDDDGFPVEQNFGATLYRASGDLWSEATPVEGTLRITNAPETCYGPDCEMLAGSFDVGFVSLRGKLYPEEVGE